MLYPHRAKETQSDLIPTHIRLRQPIVNHPSFSPDQERKAIQ
jgi:hypothetical protein